jgi:hypothetical protein
MEGKIFSFYVLAALGTTRSLMFSLLIIAQVQNVYKKGEPSANTRVAKSKAKNIKNS